MAKRKNNKSNDFGEIIEVSEVEDDGFIEGDLDLSKHKLVTSFSFGSGDGKSNPPPSEELQQIAVHSIPETPVSFHTPAEVRPTGMLFQSKEPSKTVLEQVDNRTLQTIPNGKTPPVDGENFEVSRTFMFRRSTVRILNRMKAEHPDENVYLSSIVDEALRYYYEQRFGK